MIDTGITRDSHQIARETEKAICILVDTMRVGRPRQVWLPKSKITWTADLPQYPETLHVPCWLARQENLGR